MKYQMLVAASFLLLSGAALAQGQVNADEIVAKINRGEAVSYQNTKVTGDLDLTQLEGRTFKVEKQGEYSADTIFISTVKVPVNFTNCTFDGKLIGYYNPDNGKEVVVRTAKIYNTNFEKDIVFSNCTFEKEVNLKYSKFDGKANFSGSRFQDLAFFKYADFAFGPDFSQTQFKSLSFKYVKFPKEVSFAGARFAGDTDFKYAEFPGGADFQKANFEGFANFKYAKLSNPNLKGAMFSGSGDFKYTMVNNRKMPLTDLSDNKRVQ
jgi:uncharacterized protein YjbI with pentapeptide repeats